MNQKTLNNMIEQSTPQERRQFKATANVFTNTLRVKMRKQRAEAERKIELGVEMENEYGIDEEYEAMMADEPERFRKKETKAKQGVENEPE